MSAKPEKPMARCIECGTYDNMAPGASYCANCGRIPGDQFKGTRHLVREDVPGGFVGFLDRVLAATARLFGK